MKKMRILFLLIVPAIAQAHRAVLIDLLQQEQYVYHPFIEACASAHLTLDYLAVSQLLDMDEKETARLLTDYRGAFFALSYEFLKHIDARTPASTKIRNLITAFCAKEKALNGILMPPSNTGLKTLQSLVAGDETLHKALEPFLATSLEKRNRRYETTLLPAQEPKEPLEWQTSAQDITFLPTQNKDDTTLVPLLPLAFLWHNQRHNNHLFFSQISLATCLSIAEHMWLCPVEPRLKEQLFNLLQRTMHECIQKIDTKTDRTFSYKTLPQGQPSYAAPKIKCAWMGIEIFEVEEKKTEQIQLIDYILTSKMTHLWLTLSPNWYYSPRATRTEHKDVMLKSVERFTHHLKKAAEQAQQAVPKIMIGFEIAYNYGKHQPQHTVRDLYGTTYHDLPSPLSTGLWNNELVLPFHQFLQDWKKISPLPIAGIMLDLEMYGRSSGAFLPTMGFDKQTYERITKNKSDDPVDALIKNKSMHNYCDLLYQQSIQTGQLVIHALHKILPHLEIGCYAPTIYHGWFYKGFYRGLSEHKKNNLLLLTFNSHATQHASWLKKNKIHAHHLGVLLFSKIKNESDFKKVDAVLQHNDGIWLNRFNWLTEPYKKDVWYELESTPLDHEQRKILMHYIGAA